ncbi:MAG: hypothetical protein ACXACX_19670 [Candidatus Hodarchaeales archaeon]|jgi:hypothetical protein
MNEEAVILSSSFFNKLRPHFKWILVLLFLLIQIIRALEPPSLLHPDQVYQSYEIGHYYFYGYGLRAWEWLSPEETYWSDPFIGPARSLITPIFFYILFAIGETFSLSYWNQILPLTRIVLGIITSLGLIGLSLVIREIFPKFKELIFIVFWLIMLINPTFILNGPLGFTNMIAIFPLWWGFFLYTKTLKGENLNKNRIIGVFSGFLLGISVWLRPDFAILIMVLLIIFFPLSIYIKAIRRILFHKNNVMDSNEENLSLNRSKNLLSYYIGAIIKDKGINILLTVFVGGFFSFILNGLLDLVVWGEFSISVINFLKFNGNPENQAIFGTQPFGWYFFNSIVAKPTMNFLFIIILLAVLVSLILIVFPFITKKIYNYQNKERIEQINDKYLDYCLGTLRIFLIIGIVLIWWETQPHKESRFIFAWESLFLFLSAISMVLLTLIVVDFILIITKLKKKENHTIKKLIKVKTAFIVLIVIITMIPYYNGTFKESETLLWKNFDDVLEAQVIIGQQDDLTGLIIIGRTWYDGGYTFLHKNVSIMRIESPGVNSSLNYFLRVQNEHNYLIAPHYKYYEFEFLKFNLEEYNWILQSTVLERTDIWVR